jgi:hypothetical protein
MLSLFRCCSKSIPNNKIVPVSPTNPLLISIKENVEHDIEILNEQTSSLHVDDTNFDKQLLEYMKEIQKNQAVLIRLNGMIKDDQHQQYTRRHKHTISLSQTY